MNLNKFSFTVLFIAIFSLWLNGCLTDSSSPEEEKDIIALDTLDNDTNDIVALGISEFDISGEVLDDDGEPVKGAIAKLLKSGLVAITDEDGIYQIKSLTGGIAKKATSC